MDPATRRMMLLAGADKALPASTYRGSAVDTNVGPSFSFPSLPLGTSAGDRLVVVLVHGDSGTTGRTVTSVRIGTLEFEIVAATNVSGQRLTTFAYALLPLGTAGAVSVDFSANVNRAAIDVWTITGLEDFEPVATGRDASSPWAASLTVPEHAVLLAGLTTNGANTSGNTATWSGGVSEHSDYNATLNTTCSAASLSGAAAGTYNISVTSTHTNGVMSAVAFR